MKFKFLLTPLLSSVLFLSACSATFEADLKNLIKETDGKDLDVSKLIITSEGKQILIGYLKKSYEVNSEKTTELLLNAWKQSAEKNEIGIDLFNWTKSIFSGVNTFDKKQKVEYFNMTYKGISDVSVKAKLNHTLTWNENYSYRGFNIHKGDKHYFNSFLTLKANSYLPFTSKNFDVYSKRIRLSVSFHWILKGKDELSQKILDKTVLNGYIEYIVDNYQINLFRYLVYLIE
ncbi:lipoprotein [Mycoplasmoides pneumoniae]|uniref:lipoprotein n=1 Tax=Mycoplasmoides pneumoniae TaxID=2104 RepID=UPI0006A6E6A4|nr:MPN647 family lipoprotein [Mycoplasmoides pneumoniae]ALA31295.1 hypothetical protein F536_00055 [Mycoplasmoides pneumoniae 39443]ALA37645.1 hypothetical protein G667_00055 [Mycoplasmoides pneumoniae M2592]ARQ38422.1 hypothetical protein BIX59_00055 [Mycoplasmoides pneumoniae]ARQ39126.1 hypothetical protein BIX55_00055 [Mycoplasmoides pneumoniae]ARQ40540.1 hypothetical protein BIX65_00055 [Mycoplasmoides pneumoniae]